MSRASGRALLLTLVSVAVVVAAVAAFRAVGTPGEARARRYDLARVDDLSAIADGIDAYWREHHALPAALDSLPPLARRGAWQADPRSGVAYGYRVTGARSYELCADFERAAAAAELEWRNGRWAHGPGRQCFAREVPAR
jgi:hypothetical protein